MGAVVALHTRYVLVYGTDTVFDRERMQQIRISALRHVYGHTAVKAWLGSPARNMVYDLKFEPGSDQRDDVLNLWRGFAVEPAAGDCKPILAVLHHLCSEAANTAEGSATVMAWVLRWLALPLQRPGAKMATAIVVHGPEGTGKNLFFELVADLYGEHATVVGQDQLETQFNDWLSAKVFVIGDEVVSRQELRHFKGKLKAMVTGREHLINAKMVPLRRETNHTNVVFLSNELQPLALDDTDRRYLVIHTPPARERAFYEAAAHCARAGGTAALMHYLQSLPLGDFNEHTPPPRTNAKADLVDLGLSPPERFWREWSAGLLDLPLQPCTNEQAFRAYSRWCSRAGVRWTGEQATFSRALRRACGAAVQHKVVQVVDGSAGRRTSLRCLIPSGCGVPEGQSEGQWMADSRDIFQRALEAFMHAEAAA